MNSKTIEGKALTNRMWNKFSAPIYKELEVVSRESAKSLSQRDGHVVSTDPDDYSRRNWISYYLITNTWLLQVREVSERGCLELHDAILKQGLLNTIAVCDGVANNFLRQYGEDECDSKVPLPGYLVYLLSACENDRQALQLLRYPKRFSPDGADLIREESVRALLSINRRCKGFNRTGFTGWVSYKPNRVSKSPSRFWIEHIREVIADMLHGYDLDVTDGIFSTGVAADSKRPLAEKLDAFSSWECCLFQSPLYPISGSAGRKVWETSPFDSDFYCALVQAVPKSYKTARIIAEEHVYRQYGMQAIRREIERCLKANGYEDYLDLHSQLRNQEYAKHGSMTGRYATIDLSSASDSVSRVLAYEVLPRKLVSDVDTYLPRLFQVGTSNRHTMHMFCTSGSAVTFPVESVIFLAIAMAVREVTSALTGEFYLPPVVFGDDIVVDTSLYDTVTEVLGQLGFVVNTLKSYGPGTLYRESCGCEYVCGYDLKSVYWPRATFVWDRDHMAATLAQLCSLEHQLFGCYYARALLVHTVRDLEPRMTSHGVGTECADLWEDIPIFQERGTPVGLPGTSNFGYSDCLVREGHLTLKTRWRGEVPVPSSADINMSHLVEMWRYANFLRSGPRYDSELDRVLGVSSKPTPVIQDCIQGEVYWGWETEIPEISRGWLLD